MEMNGSFPSEYFDEQLDGQNMLLLVVVSLVSFGGFVGNGHVFLVYTCRLRSRTTFKACIIWLSILDLLNSICVMPMDIVYFRYPYSLYNAAGCKMKHYLAQWISFGSVAVTLVIAIDRYKKLCKPTHTQIRYKEGRILCGVLVLMLSIVLIPLPVMVGLENAKILSNNVTLQKCGIDQSLQDSLVPKVIIFFFVVVLYVASVAVVAIYFQLGKFLLLRQSRMFPTALVKLARKATFSKADLKVMKADPSSHYPIPPSPTPPDSSSSSVEQSDNEGVTEGQTLNRYSYKDIMAGLDVQEDGKDNLNKSLRENLSINTLESGLSRLGEGQEYNENDMNTNIDQNMADQSQHTDKAFIHKNPTGQGNDSIDDLQDDNTLNNEAITISSYDNSLSKKIVNLNSSGKDMERQCETDHIQHDTTIAQSSLSKEIGVTGVDNDSTQTADKDSIQKCTEKVEQLTSTRKCEREITQENEDIPMKSPPTTDQATYPHRRFINRTISDSSDPSSRTLCSSMSANLNQELFLSQKRERRRKRSNSVVKMCFIIAVVCLLCLIPVTITFPLTLTSLDKNKFVYVFVRLGQRSPYFRSFVNPLIYGFLDIKFRHACVDMYSSVTRKLRGQRSSRVSRVNRVSLNFTRTSTWRNPFTVNMAAIHR